MKLLDYEVTGLSAIDMLDPIWRDVTGSDLGHRRDTLVYGLLRSLAVVEADRAGEALTYYVLSTEAPGEFGDAIPFLSYLSGGTTESPAPQAPSTAAIVEDIHDSSGLTWDQIARALAVSKRTVLLWAKGSKVNSKNLESIMSLKHLIDATPGDSEARRTALLATSSSTASALNEWARHNAARSTRVNAPTLPPSALMG